MAKTDLNKFKMEVAQELGVTLGGERTSRENGSVGGEMVKKMIALTYTRFAGHREVSVN